MLAIALGSPVSNGVHAMSRVMCVVTVFCWSVPQFSSTLGCMAEQRRLCLWLSAHSRICSSNSSGVCCHASGVCGDKLSSCFSVTGFQLQQLHSCRRPGNTGSEQVPRILLLRASLSTSFNPSVIYLSALFFSSSLACRTWTHPGSNMRAALCCGPSQGNGRRSSAHGCTWG